MYSHAIKLNISDLLNKLHSSSKPNPKSELLQGVWDFKQWIAPFQGKLDNHSKYHVFRFTRGTSSKVFYKINLHLILFSCLHVYAY